MSKTQGPNKGSQTHAKDSLGGYASSAWGKELVLAPAKVGKTITLVGNLLGVMPWQEYGGVVTRPENLHVFTFDAATLGGAHTFFTKQCGAHQDVAKVHVVNLQDATAKAFSSTTDYDSTFPSLVMTKLREVQDRAAKGNEVHAVVFASLTMLAKAWLRSISGPALVAGVMRKSPMDQNKWGLFAQQMTEFQFNAQGGEHHTVWETHWAERESKTKKDSTGAPVVLDTIQVQGATATQFPAQVERPYMLTRRKGGWKQGSKVDMVEFDTQPNLDFGESIMSGRQTTGVLEPKENDMTLMFNKLGLRIGGWGT